MPKEAKRRPRWTREEDEAIRRNYPDIDACERALGELGCDRERRNIMRRARVLGMSDGVYNEPWTDEEMRVVVEAYPTEGPNGVRDRLRRMGRERTVSAICTRAKIMDVKRIDMSRDGRWTDEEIALALSEFPKSSTATVRRRLLEAGYDRTESAINARAQILGVKRSPVRRAERRGDMKVMNFVLDTKLDKDVIEALRGKRNRSEYIRNLIVSDIKSQQSQK